VLAQARGGARVEPAMVQETVEGYLAGVGALVGYLDRYRSAERRSS